jgi:hypothetical protein
MESCYDCIECKVKLPVFYGHIQFTGAPIEMRCARGLWEDDKEGEPISYIRNSLFVNLKQLEKPVFKAYFDLCAERRLNGEKSLDNVDYFFSNE